jgi:glycosyltransferase involved in cell wall biosynthesis
VRILMLSQFYWPAIGGVERHVQDLSTELAARGHEVAVATLWQKGLPEFELDSGVRVYRIRGSIQRAAWLFSTAGRRYAPPIPDPETMLALRRVIARERPQIVHAHNWLVHSFLPLKNWSGARLIMSVHDHSLRCAKTTLIYHGAVCDGPGFGKCLGCAAEHYGLAKGVPTVLGNWVMGVAERRGVDRFLPVSQAVAAGNGLVGSGLPFQVVPNFITQRLEAMEDVGHYLAQLPAQDYLLFVGALGRAKGVDVLLRAYAELPVAPPLVLIGVQTPDFQVPSGSPSQRIVLLQDWPHHAVMEAWRRCSVAIVPSIVPESFGLVAAEAMAHGRAVIAARVGALPELITDGETGLLVPPGDASALRQAIARLLADQDLRERVGQAARQRSAAFQASAVVPRFEGVYEQVLRGEAPDMNQTSATVGRTIRLPARARTHMMRET